MAANTKLPTISALIVERVRVFKSRTKIPFGRLTVLAGANSSGKSSAMLAPLLLKQTQDARFDRGALVLSGGHVDLTNFDQLQTRHARGPVAMGLEFSDGTGFEVAFDRNKRGDVDAKSNTSWSRKTEPVTIQRGGQYRRRPVTRHQFFLGHDVSNDAFHTVETAEATDQVLGGILHVPGLRTPPQRGYPIEPVQMLGGQMRAPGRFDRHVASVLTTWERDGDKALEGVIHDLKALGLTADLHAERQSDVSVSIQVSRTMLVPEMRDLVDIADVGVGVSQALPIVVALRAASPGQLVLIEQPELHLHPRAQVAMAKLLVDAAARGVRVVLETHSSILLLAIEGWVLAGTQLAPEEVVVNWFARKPDGTSKVTTSALDEEGALAGSPIDFDEVELAAHRRFLDAIEARP